MKYAYDSGIYLLEICLLESKEIKIGAKGINNFSAGFYYYIGSAQRNLKSRIDRHLKEDKNYHWHIDYFLAESKIKNCFTWPLSGKAECKLATYIKNKLMGEVIMPGFGSSDCKCETHLFLMPDDFIQVYNFKGEFPNIISG